MRYCFLSLNLVGHCDFGGGSFARSAAALKERGHEVEWVLARDFGAAGEQRSVERLAREGIAVEGPSNLLLSGFQRDAQGVARSVAELADHLRAREADVVVVDRMCTYASLAARRAGVPWANVGSDGLNWGCVRRGGREWLGHGPHKSRSFAAVRRLRGVAS